MDHAESQECVFKQKAIFRWLCHASTLCFVVAALVTTYLIVKGIRNEFVALLCFNAWVFLPFELNFSYRVMGSVSVTGQWIAYRNFWTSRTIRFRDVTDLTVNRARQRMVVKSPFGQIACGSAYQDVDKLIDLVESRVLPFLGKQSTKTMRNTRDLPRFRYPLSLKITSTVGVLLVLVVFVGLIMGIVEGFSNSREDHVMTLAAIGAFAFFLYLIYASREISLQIVLDGGHLVWTKWGAESRVPLQEISKVTRRRDWDGDDIVEIVYPEGTLKVSHTLNGFDELLALLRERVTVLWRGEETMRLPVSVRIRWWQYPLVFFVVFAGLLALVIRGVTVDLRGDGATLAVVLGMVLVVLSTAYSLGLGIYWLLFGPRRIVFGRRRIVVKSGIGIKRYPAGSVKRLYLRESEQNYVVSRVLVIEFENARSLKIGGKVLGKPITPLYALICKTYWPEGYRDPHGPTFERHNERKSG